METRKRDKLFNFEVGEECFTLYKQGPLDLTKSAQIPTYRYLLERWFTLQLEYRRSEVLRILSAEIESLSTEMNIVTMNSQAMQKLVKNVYEEFQYLFIKTGEIQRGPRWVERAKKFVEQLPWGLPGKF